MFGNFVKGSIHGFKFEDYNADGKYDPDGGDFPYGGIPFELSLDGEVVDASGIVTGGHVEGTPGLLERRREVLDLETKRQSLGLRCYSRKLETRHGRDINICIPRRYHRCFNINSK